MEQLKSVPVIVSVHAFAGVCWPAVRASVEELELVSEILIEGRLALDAPANR
jgi:hypothetical protein